MRGDPYFVFGMQMKDSLACAFSQLNVNGQNRTDSIIPSGSNPSKSRKTNHILKIGHKLDSLSVLARTEYFSSLQSVLINDSIKKVVLYLHKLSVDELNQVGQSLPKTGVRTVCLLQIKDTVLTPFIQNLSNTCVQTVKLYHMNRMQNPEELGKSFQGSQVNRIDLCLFADGSSISSFVAGLRETRVRYLSLISMTMTVSSIYHFGKSIQGGPISHIYLRNNNLGSIGIRAFVTSLEDSQVISLKIMGIGTTINIPYKFLPVWRNFLKGSVVKTNLISLELDPCLSFESPTVSSELSLNIKRNFNWLWDLKAFYLRVVQTQNLKPLGSNASKQDEFKWAHEVLCHLPVELIAETFEYLFAHYAQGTILSRTNTRFSTFLPAFTQTTPLTHALKIMPKSNRKTENMRNMS